MHRICILNAIMQALAVVMVARRLPQQGTGLVLRSTNDMVSVEREAFFCRNRPRDTRGQSPPAITILRQGFLGEMNTAWAQVPNRKTLETGCPQAHCTHDNWSTRKLKQQAIETYLRLKTFLPRPSYTRPVNPIVGAHNMNHTKNNICCLEEAPT